MKPTTNQAKMLQKFVDNGGTMDLQGKNLDFRTLLSLERKGWLKDIGTAGINCDETITEEGRAALQTA